MATNMTSYDPYDPSSPYRQNSYNTGQYGMSGSGTLASQQNATNQSAASSGGNSGSNGNYMSAFSDAANSWSPEQKGAGSPDTQSPYDTTDYTNTWGGYLQQPSPMPVSFNSPSPSRPGVTGSIGQPPPGPVTVFPPDIGQVPIVGRQPGFGMPQPPAVGGSTQPAVGVGATGAPKDKSAFYNPDGTFNTLGYYQQWLPNMTQDQLNQYWTQGQQGQSQGQNVSDWWNSRFNSDGSPKSGYQPNGGTPSTTNPVNQAGQYEPNQMPPTAQQQWGPGQYQFVPGYGWTASPEEFAAAQQQVNSRSQPSGSQSQPSAQLLTNSTAPPPENTPTLSTSPGGGYTPSAIPPPAPVQFPTSPFGTGGTTSGGPSGGPANGTTTTPAPTATTSGLTAATSPSASNTDLATQLRQLLNPEFQQEQSDLNRQLLATGAATGDINSGGFTATAGKQQARLAADQGQRLSDYLTQASEAQKNRQLQTYQIDSNTAIAQMNNETAVYGIRTNDDLQRYLNSQNNALAKYGIDKNDVLQRYIAIQNAHGQAASAQSAFNAAALQAATQQAIAAMNNQTAQQNSQNQYNLGVLGINAENYRNDSNNLLGYLNLLNNSAPQPPQPQIPGTIGYGP